MTVKRVCPCCHEFTIIHITTAGLWEIWTCTHCGGVKRYKTG